MKRLFYILQIAAAALFAVSCDKQPDEEIPEENKPEIAIAAGEVTSESISFRIDAKNVDLCAWVCLDGTAEVPEADQVFKTGRMADPESGDFIKASGLDADREYMIAVAGKGEGSEVVATAKMRTAKGEDVPEDGIYKANVLMGAFYRTDNEAGAGQYNVIFSNAVPGGFGEPLNTGDFQLYLNLYNVSDADPNHASLPSGEYKAKDDFSPFSWNPVKDVFMKRVDNTDKGTRMMAYKDGTITVSSENGVYTIDMDLILFNGEGFRARYVGNLEFERTGSSNERFETEQNVTFETPRCDYYGNWFRPHCDDVMLDFYTGTFDDAGNQIDGYYLTIPAYMDKLPDTYAPDIRLQEGVYQVADHTLTAVTSIPMYCQIGERLSFMDEYFNTGSYLQHTDGETGRILIGLITGGTMTVKHVGTGYHIEFDFISSDGVALKGVYDGEMPLANKCDNKQTAPELPLSTLTGDHQLAIPENAEAGAYMIGDYLVPGLNSWLLIIAPKEGEEGDMITSEFFTASKDFEMGTYEISRSLAASTALPGFRDFGSEVLYTWYGDMSSVDASGNATILGPVESGSFTVSGGSDSYHFVFDFVDDAGHKINGSWDGPVEVMDLSQNPEGVEALIQRISAR